MKVNYTTQRGCYGDNIIVQRDDIEVNYGALVVLTPNGGKPFVMDKFNTGMTVPADLTKPLLDCQVEEFGGEFHYPLTISIDYGHGVVNCWAVKQEDVAEVAMRLSAMVKGRVTIQAHARILATFNNGVEVGERHTLDYFYEGITDEQREQTRF